MVGLVVIRLSLTAAIDPRVVVPAIFLWASLFAWIGWLAAFTLPQVTTRTQTCVLLVAAAQVCALASGLLFWFVDETKGTANDLFWLKSSLCFAILGFTLGDAGVTATFEAVVSRKKIMQFASQRSIGCTIGCVVGSVWAMTCSVLLKSSFLTSLPLALSSGSLLYVIYWQANKHFGEHTSHSIKLQETLLKEAIRVEHQQRAGINREQTYFWSLDSEDLARDRPECVTNDPYKSRVSAGMFTSQMRSGTSQLVSGRQYQSRAGAQTFRSGVYNSTVS